MEKEKLIKVLTQYLIENPSFNEKELLEILREARKQAILTNIPTYRPLNVLDKKEILTEFEERQKKIKRVRYKDESTEEFD